MNLIRKKVLLITLRQTRNNFFVVFSQSSIRPNVGSTLLKKKLFKIRARKLWLFRKFANKEYPVPIVKTQNILGRFSKEKIKISEKLEKKRQRRINFNQRILNSLYKVKAKGRAKRKELKLMKFRWKKKVSLLKRYLKLRIKRKFVKQCVNLKNVEKKKERGHSFFYRLEKKIAYKNLILRDTLKNLTPDLQVSAGCFNNKGPIRQTPFAAEILGLKVSRLLHKKTWKYLPKIIILRTRFTKNLRNFFRGLKRAKPKIAYIIPIYKIRHGSMRKRKLRRK